MWLTTKEAAELLGKSDRTIRRMVKSGKLQSREVPGRGGNGTLFEVFIENEDTVQVHLLLDDWHVFEVPRNHGMMQCASERNKRCDNCNLAYRAHPMIYHQENQGTKYCTLDFLKYGFVEPDDNYSFKIISKNNEKIKDKNDLDHGQNDHGHVRDRNKSLENNKIRNFTDRPRTSQRHVRDQDKSKDIKHLAPTKDKVSDIAQCTVQTTVQHKKGVVSMPIVSENNELQNSSDIINIETTVQITDWSKRTIFNKIKSEEILSVRLPKEGGGYKTMVDVRSLPKEAQLKHQELLTRSNPDSGMRSLSDSQSRYAFAMQRVIQVWQEYRLKAKRDKLRIQDGDNRFLSDIREGIILKDENEILSGISIKTLYRNKKKWINSGCRASVLAPDRKGKRGRKRIKATAFYALASTWIKMQPATKASELYNQLTDHLLKERPDMRLPSYSTFLNHYNSIKKTVSISIAKHQGKKTFDEIMPYVPRKNDALPGHVWQYDGYIIKLLVHNPWLNDSLIKPVIVYFFDVATGLITGWSVSFSERSDVIAASWKHAMSRYPAPKRLMPDNPAGLYVPEFCAKQIVERETRKKYIKMKQRAIEMTMQGRNGMFFDCGVERIQFVTPGNSKGKMIEPAHNYIFRQFETQPRFADVYVGSDPSKRPEKLNRTNKALLADKTINIPEWDFIISEISKHIEYYNNRKKKSLNDFSPVEAYEQMVSPSDRLSSNDLEYKCLWVVEKTTRNGYIKLFDNIHYQHAAFTVLKKVRIGYDINDLKTVRVFSNEGREFDTPAVMVKYGSYIDDEQSVEAIKANKTFRQQTMKLQEEIIYNGYDINRLTDKELIKLMSNDNLSIEQKELVQERINELEKYPQFNRQVELPKPKRIRPKVVEEQQIEDISHIIEADIEIEEEKKDDAWLDEIINSEQNDEEDDDKKDKEKKLEDIYKHLGIGG